jgi:uncharacterized NAD-dependent epimerase/dehydratase family protein
MVLIEKLTAQQIRLRSVGGRASLTHPRRHPSPKHRLLGTHAEDVCPILHKTTKPTRKSSPMKPEPISHPPPLLADPNRFSISGAIQASR